MYLPDMFRPVLSRITSSVRSTTDRYGFINRVLSFTGSFNDRTSLLDAELGPTQAAAEPEEAAPPAPQAPEAALVTTAGAGHPFDIEAAAAALVPSAPEGQDQGSGQPPPATEDDDDAEPRRVGKSVQTVCLFAASASLMLFVNLPTSNDKPSGAGAGAASGQHDGGGGGGALYSAGMAFIGLGFFSSLSLSMFSIVVVARPGGGEAAAVVARVQKCGMVVAVASVAVAFSLRMCMVPVA